MGENARRIADGEEIKIGTCEEMYYLRADQAQLVTPQPGNVDPVRQRTEIRFRFPWPDEDEIAPGDFDRPNRAERLPTPIAEGIDWSFHNPACATLDLAVVSQRWVGDRLLLVCRCLTCDEQFRITDEQAARAIAHACLVDGSAFWTAVADRILAGYRQPGEPVAQAIEPPRCGKCAAVGTNTAGPPAHSPNCPNDTPTRADPRTYGAKYDASASTKEIAKRVRADIKEAIAEKRLPPGKYSVRIGGGRAIDVRISDCPIDLHNPERLRGDMLDPHTFVPEFHCPRLTETAREVLKRCEEILAAYNHDGSDIQTDYFDVKFYGRVTFDHAWAEKERRRTLSALVPCLARRYALEDELRAVYEDHCEQKYGTKPKSFAAELNMLRELGTERFVENFRAALTACDRELAALRLAVKKGEAA